MMKIKFRVSQITGLDPEIINGLILLKLKDKGYNVLEVTRSTVKFYDNPWVLRWNFQQIGRLDGGEFKIDAIDNQISVSLNYYLSLWQPLIALSIPVTATIIEGAYEGAIFFIVFVTIALCFQASISKNAARELLQAILIEDIMN